MDRDAISKLRLDRRLTSRRDWISPEDLERELEALPDVASKVAPTEDPVDEPASEA